MGETQIHAICVSLFHERSESMTRMDYTPERTAFQKNLFDEAMMVLAAYGFSFAQIKWAGIRDKEWWPLYQLFDILNVWWNPKSGIEPVPEGTVIVGEDYVMDWNAAYHKWQMHLLPEMPDKMNDNPCLINND